MAAEREPAVQAISSLEPVLNGGEIEVEALTQERVGPWYYLRGRVRLTTTEVLLQADEVDYNEETGEAEARGNAYVRRLGNSEELWAQRIEYNLREGTGKFYEVRGSAPARIDPRPGVLTSTNPYYFESRVAERLKNKYILYDGFITNCKVPGPWWVLHGSRFEVVPHEHALAYHSTFRVKKLPIFYTPMFYKSLESRPRKSGFITPTIGNSSRRGKTIGAGYYWAINRSHDVLYRNVYLSQRGVAHHFDLRGKPRAGTEFNAILYGVNDRGLKLERPELDAKGQLQDRRKEGGLMMSFSGSSDLGGGWYARTEANYLSSFIFRQAFTESFNEAIFSEVHSVGFVTRHWSNYGLNIVFQRQENFQTSRPSDTIVITKLPHVEFLSRDRQVWSRGLPIWISVESTAGLVHRKQPVWISMESTGGLTRQQQLFSQTRQFLERADFEPRITTALRFKDFSLIPSFALRETHWGQSQENGRFIGQNINRHSREFSLQFETPALARIFEAPSWLGERVKHVIEPRAWFRHVSGISMFDRIIRFDETELLSNTTEAQISITNRLYAKRNGNVEEVLSWELAQQRYFDPDFGGAVIEGRRNVVLSSVHLTPYSFLDRPRNYSPVVSKMRVSPRPGFGVEWRSDYDPMRSKLVVSSMTADARWSKYFLSVGQNSVRSIPQLTPGANQFRGILAMGNPEGRGWSTAFSAIYDFRFGVMQFATTQVGYNTDCCGWSFQYRRLDFGFRQENQFRVAFTVSNIGSFGTLKKQERLF